MSSLFRQRLGLLIVFFLLGLVAFGSSYRFSNPTIYPAGDASFPPVGIDIPANSEVWDVIASDGTIVAKTSSPGGWTVSLTNDTFSLHAPASANVAPNYEVRCLSGSSTGTTTGSTTSNTNTTTGSTSTTSTTSTSGSTTSSTSSTTTGTTATTATSASTGTDVYTNTGSTATTATSASTGTDVYTNTGSQLPPPSKKKAAPKAGVSYAKSAFFDVVAPSTPTPPPCPLLLEIHECSFPGPPQSQQRATPCIVH